MAWSWSHTPEAYANARANLEQLDSETLRVIAAEWEAQGESDGAFENFSQRRYKQAYDAIGYCPADSLAEGIWDKASEQATCDNGGFNAWVCPYGCHTVPFDPA